jgi:hypothetical protein
VVMIKASSGNYFFPFFFFGWPKPYVLWVKVYALAEFQFDFNLFSTMRLTCFFEVLH